MKTSRLSHFIVWGILGAYLVPAILNQQALLGQSFFFTRDASSSIKNERSIDLDERPYWISHRHLISSEKFSSDHLLSASGQWTDVIIPGHFFKIHAAYTPAHSHFIPQNAFRAPPRHRNSEA